MNTLSYKSFFALTCLFLSFTLQAKVSKTIHITTAGSLPASIPLNEKYQIASLTISGSLNGTDIRFIREMAGKNVIGDVTTGKLSVLNLSEATIVKGGDFYCETSSDNYTDENMITENMFLSCSKLTSVILPKNLKSIGDHAFEDCTGLKEIKIPEGVSSIGISAFNGCNGLTSVSIPSSVYTINDYAFARCNKLDSISISGAVFCIRNGTFSGCSNLSVISLAGTVNSIDEYAFSDCVSLKRMHVKAPIPPQPTKDSSLAPQEGETFLGIKNTTCTLIIPEGALASYKKEAGWKDFKQIIEEKVNGSTK